MKNILKSSTAYNQIRDWILSGEYLPGSRLVLADLEKRLGLGKGPIRDALMRLDLSGLIENVPFKGAIVKAPPTPRELEYIYGARLMLEKEIVLVSLQKATAHDVSRLQKLVDLSRKDPHLAQTFYTHDRKFHDYLYKIANMQHMKEIIAMLHEHLAIFLNQQEYDDDYWQESIRQHQEIVDAIRDKDEARLISNLEDNTAIGFSFVQRLLAKK